MCACVFVGRKEIVGFYLCRPNEKKNSSHGVKVKSTSYLTAKPAYDILWKYEMGFAGL